MNSLHTHLQSHMHDYKSTHLLFSGGGGLLSGGGSSRDGRGGVGSFGASFLVISMKLSRMILILSPNFTFILKFNAPYVNV